MVKVICIHRIGRCVKLAANRNPLYTSAILMRCLLAVSLRGRYHCVVDRRVFRVPRLMVSSFIDRFDFDCMERCIASTVQFNITGCNQTSEAEGKSEFEQWEDFCRRIYRHITNRSRRFMLSTSSTAVSEYSQCVFDHQSKNRH